MRDYTLYLKDVLAAIESIEDFITGMDVDSFQTDDKTASAVMRKYERQANPLLLWRGLSSGLESNYRATASS